MKLWLKKSQNVKKFQSQKGRTGWGLRWRSSACSGVWRGTLAKGHSLGRTCCAPGKEAHWLCELFEDWGREDAPHPPHCPFWNLPGASGFWLWSLISTWFLWELQEEGQGLRLSPEEGPWHCVVDFDRWSGCQGPSRDIRCSRFLRDRQKSSRGLRAFCQLSY